MRQYKLLEVTTQYGGYLNKFCSVHNDIDQLSYSELFSLLVEDGFAESNFIHPELHKLGIESKIIFYNNKNLQDKWNSKHREITYFEILLLQIKEFAPDVILVSDICAFTKEETASIKESIPTAEKKMVGFHFTTINSKFEQNVSLYNQIYTGSKSYVTLMRNYGIPAFLLRHAFEPRILEKLPEVKRKNEICFAGSIYRGKNLHNNRLDMLNALNISGVPYTFYGNIYGYEQVRNRNSLVQQIFYIKAFISECYCFPRFLEKHRESKIEKEEEKKYLNIVKKIEKNKKSEIYGIEYYLALNQYNICLNLHSPILGTGAGNMRMFESTGVGTCLLTDYRDENTELFDTEREIVVYKSYEDMVEKAKWLLNNPGKAKEIAFAGQKRTLACYTYRNKAQQFNEYIQELLK